jgi:hypothetical protein
MIAVAWVVNRFRSAVVCLPCIGIDFVEDGGSDSESAKVAGHGIRSDVKAS